MVKHCCWGVCKSDSRYADREYMTGVTWFPFPKPFSQPEKCQMWVTLCGRKNFMFANVNKATYICSKHFVSGGPTVEHPDPLPAAGTTIDVERAQRKKRRVLSRVEQCRVQMAQMKRKLRMVFINKFMLCTVYVPIKIN